MPFDPHLSPGDSLTNRQIIDTFRVDNMNGIRPSQYTRSIVLTTSTARDALYKDRWEHERYLYTGMGKHGDQLLTGRNKSLAEHRNRGLHLFLFDHTNKDDFVFMGEFDLAGRPQQEMQRDVAGAERQVWMFPLVPVSARSTARATVPAKQVTVAAGTVLLSKKMDRSLFHWGTTLPQSTVAQWDAALGAHVHRGKKMPIRLLVDGTAYEAVIQNADRAQIADDTYQVRYDSNQALKELLRRRYPFYSSFTEAARVQGMRDGKARPRTDTTDAPTVSLVATPSSNSFELRLEPEQVPAPADRSPLIEQRPFFVSAPIADEGDILRVGERRIRALRDFDPDLDSSRASQEESRLVQASYSYELQELASENHRRTLRALSSALVQMGLCPRESNIDLVASAGDAHWLFEVKSIRNTNVRSQTRMAIGQLLDYRYFETEEIGPTGPTEMAIVYSRMPPPEFTKFVTSLDLHCFWVDGSGGLTGSDNSLRALRNFASSAH